MELDEAMRTQNACRFYEPTPVPDEVFYRAIESARCGPQGGNRQPVRFVIVRDPAKKKAMADLYIVPWNAYIEAARAGIQAIAAQSEDHTDKATWIGMTNPAKSLNDADEFARNFAEHPTIVVVCADIANTHPTDTGLDRLSIVGGASVYPIAQNFCLALRNQGVATTLTTLLVEYEPQVKELLGIPEEYSTACHIVAGYPAKGFPKKLLRSPVEELAFVDTWGAPLQASQSALA